MSCTRDQSDLITSAIVRTPEYVLGVVEFDDQGWLFGAHGRDQLLTVMNMLNQEATQGGAVTLVVFVHGWKHNASSNDPNVLDFQRLLSRVKSASPDRRVIGIYVSWRGLSVSGGEPLPSTTLLDRKQTAEHVAKGSVRELFARIHQFQSRFNAEGNNDLVSVVIGHSFGGLIVYNAMSQVLLDSAVGDPATPVTPYFDLTILVNPAFEASRYEALHEVATCRSFRADQFPVFVSLTASNDTATGGWFRAYRWLVTRFERYYEPKERAHLEKSGQSTQRENHRTHVELEEEANRNTIGYVERYRTHSLYLEGFLPPRDDTYQSRFFCANACGSLDKALESRPPHNQDEEIATNGVSMVLRHEPRENCDCHTPFWVVRVDKKIIDGHDGFFNLPDAQHNYFTNLVAHFIRKRVETTLSMRRTTAVEGNIHAPL